MTIGITTDKMIKNLPKATYENQSTRTKNLKQFLKENKLTNRSKIILLNDIYGNTTKDNSIQALIVSDKTLPNAKIINKIRQKDKLKKLYLLVCPQILAADKELISSGRIRNGKIDRAGQSYTQILQKFAARPIREKTRLMLKNPLGPLTKLDKVTTKKYPPFVAVGDITVANFLKVGLVPKISIVDFLVERQKRYSQLAELGFATNNPDAIVKNPPGQISKDLINQIERAIKSKNSSMIIVDGEEDLAAVPAILLSPLGEYVYYGQPQRGAVKVEITEKIKEYLLKILIK